MGANFGGTTMTQDEIRAEYERLEDARRVKMKELEKINEKMIALMRQCAHPRIEDAKDVTCLDCGADWGPDR